MQDYLVEYLNNLIGKYCSGCMENNVWNSIGDWEIQNHITLGLILLVVETGIAIYPCVQLECFKSKPIKTNMRCCEECGSTSSETVCQECVDSNKYEISKLTLENHELKNEMKKMALETDEIKHKIEALLKRLRRTQNTKKGVHEKNGILK